MGCGHAPVLRHLHDARRVLVETGVLGAQFGDRAAIGLGEVLQHAAHLAAVVGCDHGKVEALAACGDGRGKAVAPGGVRGDGRDPEVRIERTQRRSGSGLAAKPVGSLLPRLQQAQRLVEAAV